MTPRRISGRDLAALFVTISLGALSLQPVQAAEAQQSKPTLVIAISIDQFSAGLFDQYRTSFRHGLKRLTEQGAVFPNGYQSHAMTETCPGHSTLLTGRHPSATGIVGNHWFSASGQDVYCVEDNSEIGRAHV